jgi:hypothetical protein
MYFTVPSDLSAERHAVRQVDIHEHPGLAARYSVRTTPTILLMKDGDGYFSTASSTRGRRTPNTTPQVA